MNSKEIDKPFLAIVVALVVVGLFIFSSASLGLVARDGAPFGIVFMRQLIFGVFLGGFLAYWMSKIDYRNWRNYGFYIFILSVLLTLAVWIPGLGFEHGGAKRWLSLGFMSFQPAEVLKLGFIVYFSAWLTSIKDGVRTFKWGVIPYLVLIGIVAVVLLIQPDTDTLFVIAAAGMGIFLIAGAKWRHILLIIIAGVLLLAGLVVSRPYLMARVSIYLNPLADPLGAGYQIQQSLIAVGSGNWFGRGLGQSVQKFEYLPEPIGDSIFAVFAEEWGLIGSILLLGLFTAFIIRGFQIALRAPTQFGTLLVSGIALMIGIQSLFNISAMLGLVPLSGMPLIFVSQGGSALALALLEVGIIMNVSRQMRKE
jgi:cell division protein FtsW